MLNMDWQRNWTAKAILLGSLLAVAHPAKAQLSRAIPPDESPAEIVIDQTIPSSAETGMKPKAVRPQGRRSYDSPNLPVIPVGKIVTSVPSWGVAVKQFDRYADIKEHWPQIRGQWSFLRGLYPAFSRDRSTKSFILIFGPLSKGQAIGLCHEARRDRRQCAPVIFGKVSEKKKKAPKASASKASAKDSSKKPAPKPKR